jgi:microcystin-dependent protein
LPGLSAKSIVNVDGSALAAGEVKSGSYIEIVYNASADKFFLVLNVLNSTLGIPTGGIILWSGTVATIPAGFAICDGTNGTPDLTGQFVVHADADTGGTYAPGDSGGSDTHGHSDDFSVDDHTLTIAEMPAHTHDLQGGTAGSTDTISVTSTDTPTTFGATESTGGGDPHGHTLSGSVTDATTLPPYYALAYIMKL